MDATTRLDIVLVQRGLARSRARAREVILAGEVRVAGAVVTKPATPIGPGSDIEVDSDREWVGRAAHKLLGALETFPIDVSDARCLDIGACTGGFTQVLLWRGAAHVVALDVGHDQLAPELLADPRVTERSGTSIRGVTPEDIGGAVDVVVGDLSFISLRLVLPEVAGLLGPDGEAVLLIKPQFEVGRGRVGRRGVVTSPGARRDAVLGVLGAATGAGLVVRGLARSPIVGGEGNHEYLVHLTRGGEERPTWEALQVMAHEVVHEEER